MLLCTSHITGRIPGAAFAPRMVFLLVQNSGWCSSLLLTLSVFQLRPAKDNASSQLPTLLLISLVLKLQPTLVLPFYTLVNVLNVHPSNVHLSEAPAIRTEVTIQYD